MPRSDYTLIEYIEGVSGAYINLGSTYGRPTRNNSMGALFTPNMSDSTASYIWGGSDGTNTYTFGFASNAANYYSRYGRQNSSTSTTPVYAGKTWYYQLITINQTCQWMWESEDEQFFLSKNFSYSTQSSTLGVNLYLMCRNNNGTATNYAIGTKLYHYYSYNENSQTATITLVPALRKSDSRPGMYDVDKDVFFTSATSTDFIAGPSIEDSAKIWIKSNGSWTAGKPWLKTNGSWTSGKPWLKTNGSWQQGS